MRVFGMDCAEKELNLVELGATKIIDTDVNEGKLELLSNVDKKDISANLRLLMSVKDSYEATINLVPVLFDMNVSFLSDVKTKIALAEIVAKSVKFSNVRFVDFDGVVKDGIDVVLFRTLTSVYIETSISGQLLNIYCGKYDIVNVVNRLIFSLSILGALNVNDYNNISFKGSASKSGWATYLKYAFATSTDYIVPIKGHVLNYLLMHPEHLTLWLTGGVVHHVVTPKVALLKAPNYFECINLNAPTNLECLPNNRINKLVDGFYEEDGITKKAMSFVRDIQCNINDICELLRLNVEKVVLDDAGDLVDTDTNKVLYRHDCICHIVND